MKRAMSTRAISFVSAILSLSALCGAQDLDKKVTFKTVAGSAKSVLERLGTECGVTFMTTPATESEPLIIDVRDQSVKAIMDRIAFTLDAQWQSENGGFRLIRSQSTATAQANKFRQRQIESTKVELDKLAAELNKFGAYSADKAKAEAEKAIKRNADLQEQINRNSGGGGGGGVVTFRGSGPDEATSPATHTLKRLLVALGPTTLGSIDRGSRVVFALTPTRVQRQLPSVAQRALNDFLTAHAAYIRAMGNQPQDTTPNTIRILDPSTEATGAQGGVSEALLTVNRFVGGSLIANLAIYDGRGVAIAQADFSINMAPPNPTGTASEVDNNLSPIQVSDQSKKHAQYILNAPLGGGNGMFMARSSGGARTMSISVTRGIDLGPPPQNVEVTNDWKAIFADPSKYEPLSFAASDFMLGLADATKSNLVATLPDSALLPFSTRAAEGLSPRAAVQALRGQIDSQVEIKDGWITVRPNDPHDVRLNRFNRRAATTFLKSIVSGQGVSLDALSNFSNSMYYARTYPLMSRTVALVNPDVRQNFDEMMSNPLPFQLYAQIPVTARQSLGRGDRLSYGSLAPSQRAIYDHMVFDSFGGPNQDETAAPVPMPPGSRGRQMRAGGDEFPRQTLQDERTEYLAAGISANAGVTLSFNSEDSVFGTVGTSGDGRFMNAGELAMYMNLAEGGLRFAGGPGDFQPSFPKFDTFRLGRQTRTILRLVVTPTHSMTEYLAEASHDGQRRSFNELPAGFKSEVEKVLQEMKQNRPPTP